MMRNRTRQALLVSVVVGQLALRQAPFDLPAGRQASLRVYDRIRDKVYDRASDGARPNGMDNKVLWSGNRI